MSAVPPLATETARVNMHTLDENHGFLAADSFDASFGELGAAINSTSEIGGFRFDDAFFEPFDGLDMDEGIGDDLVRELGEEWGAIPTKQNAEELSVYSVILSCVDVDPEIFIQTRYKLALDTPPLIWTTTCM